MSTSETGSESPGASAQVDMKLEVVVLPVSDVERAREFYDRLGWRLDGDFRTGDTFRVLQYTPTGSSCSVHFGKNVTTAAPGSAQGLHLVVSDIQAAREDLVARGIDASEVFHCETGYACRFPGNDAPVPGRHPEGATYGSFVSFNDPDGNGWVLQEVTTRFPGRVQGATTFGSAAELAEALKRAEAAHGEHETRTGEADADWPAWYADYMVREHAGEDLPS